MYIFIMYRFTGDNSIIDICDSDRVIYIMVSMQIFQFSQTIITRGKTRIIHITRYGVFLLFIIIILFVLLLIYSVLFFVCVCASIEIYIICLYNAFCVSINVTCVYAYVSIIHSYCSASAECIPMVVPYIRSNSYTFFYVYTPIYIYIFF